MWSSADSPALRNDVVYPGSRPPYILAIRAQALDKVQGLIMDVTIVDGGRETLCMPTPAQWEAIVDAAFPPPPMACAPDLLTEIKGRNTTRSGITPKI